MFDKIYGFMKYISFVLGLAAIALYVNHGIFDNTGYNIILITAILLLLIIGIVDILSRRKIISIFKEGTSQVIVAHITIMLSVCALIAVAMNKNGVNITSALAVIAVLIVFTMVMMFLLLRIYKMLNDLSNSDDNSNEDKESE